jgi:group I intron endonuclease
MIKSGIYKITNIINGKLYIGSTINFAKRKADHFFTLRNNKHVNSHLQRSYNKYGEENFIFEVIERIENLDILIERESYWINFYHSNERELGFNARISTTTNLGVKYSEESKLNMSNAQKGRKKSEEHKKKLSEANKGHVPSQETREKLSIAGKGRILTEETKAKMSAASKGKPKSDEARKNMSEAKKGKPGIPRSEETRKKISESKMGDKNPMYNKPMSEETKAKMSNSRMGHPTSEETKKKISDAHKRRRGNNEG